MSPSRAPRADLNGRSDYRFASKRKSERENERERERKREKESEREGTGESVPGCRKVRERVLGFFRSFFQFVSIIRLENAIIRRGHRSSSSHFGRAMLRVDKWVKGRKLQRVERVVYLSRCSTLYALSVLVCSDDLLSAVNLSSDASCLSVDSSSAWSVDWLTDCPRRYMLGSCRLGSARLISVLDNSV